MADQVKMETRTTTTVDTKKDKDSPSKQTVFTIDWAGSTDAQLRAAAQAWLIVKRQGVWRSKAIPATETVMFKDHAPGLRAPAMTLEQQLAQLTPDERKALLAKYAGK